MMQALTREDLRRELWRFTEWRANAAAIEHLLTTIDAYVAQQVPSIDAVQRAEEIYFPPEIRRDLTRSDLEHVAAVTNFRGGEEVRPSFEEIERIEAAAALDDDLDDFDEPQYDWKKFGHELAKLCWRYDVGVPGKDALDGAGVRRIAELSELFGHMFAAAHWMRQAAFEYGDELAKAWLEDLGDGMAFTDLGDMTYTQGGELLLDISEVVTRNDAIAAVKELDAETTDVDDDETRTKVCRRCKGDPKPITAFARDKGTKDGYRGTCKKCINEQRREREAAQASGKQSKRGPHTPWIEDSSEDIAAGAAKRCVGPCNQELSLENFHRDSTSPDGRAARCKRCRNGAKGAI